MTRLLLLTFRCTGLRSKHGSCQQLNLANERFALPLEPDPANHAKPESEPSRFRFKRHRPLQLLTGLLRSASAGAIRSCPSPPLFVPAKPEKKSARRRRKHAAEHGGGSTDSGGPPATGETSKRTRRKGRADSKSDGRDGKKADGPRGGSGGGGEAGASRRSETEDSRGDPASSGSQEERASRRVGGHVTAGVPGERQRPHSQTAFHPCVCVVKHFIRSGEGAKSNGVSFSRFKGGRGSPRPDERRGAARPGVEAGGSVRR